MIIEFPKHTRHLYGRLEGYDTDNLKIAYAVVEDNDYFGVRRASFMVDNIYGSHIRRWDIFWQLPGSAPEVTPESFIARRNFNKGCGTEIAYKLSELRDNLYSHLVRVGVMSWSEWCELEGWSSRSQQRNENGDNNV